MLTCSMALFLAILITGLIMFFINFFDKKRSKKLDREYNLRVKKIMARNNLTKNTMIFKVYICDPKGEEIETFCHYKNGKFEILI